MTIEKRNSRRFILLFMGMLSAFGPFVTDFYLPTLPQLTNDFETTTSLVQLTLTFSMIGLAVGQMIIGPLSDKYGRRTPLILSLALFIVSTVACLYARDIHSFLICRFIQGFAGAGGLVISRSIVTDLYTGSSLEKENRFQGGVFSTFTRFIPVLCNRRFTQHLIIQTFAMGVLFGYIAASPFIFQEYYHVSPLMYSICFGANALGIMIGSSLLVPRFRTAQRALHVGSSGFFVLGLCAAAALIADMPFGLVESLLFLLLVSLGMVLPTSTALALDMERKNAGNASALLGFTQFLFGGIVSPLTGMGSILVSTGVIIAVCCVVMYLTSRVVTEK